jgi:hypothetical protein
MSVSLNKIMLQHIYNNETNYKIQYNEINTIHNKDYNNIINNLLYTLDEIYILFSHSLYSDGNINALTFINLIHVKIVSTNFLKYKMTEKLQLDISDILDLFRLNYIFCSNSNAEQSLQLTNYYIYYLRLAYFTTFNNNYLDIIHNILHDLEEKMICM